MNSGLKWTSRPNSRKLCNGSQSFRLYLRRPRLSRLPLRLLKIGPLSDVPAISDRSCQQSTSIFPVRCFYPCAQERQISTSYRFLLCPQPRQHPCSSRFLPTLYHRLPPDPNSLPSQTWISPLNIS